MILTADRRAEAVQLHVAEGLSFAEIADLYGVTRERIRQVVRDAGAPSLTRKRQRERTEARRLMAAVAYAARRELHAPQHGSYTRYLYGCRCEPCTAANTRAHARLSGRTPPRHGTASGYFNYGCRCRACSDAGSLMNRSSRHLRIARGRA